MAKLSASGRKALPSNAFGIPSERKFPVEDASHARNAKARASEMEHEGKISAGEERRIDRKADRKLGVTHGYGR